METISRPELMVWVLFLGGLAHIRAAYRVAVGNEGMLWLWTRPSRTRIERLARYSFYVWVGSCAALLLPLPANIAIGIVATVLFAHLITFSFR
jgi:hypothetical protein